MNHQKLQCYKMLLELVKDVQAVMPGWPRGRGGEGDATERVQARHGGRDGLGGRSCQAAHRGSAEIWDQLRRALSSAVLNLVEGNGRRTTKDRKCFFNRATASLTEASACFDLISIYDGSYSTQAAEHKMMLGRIYGMIRSLP